MKYIHTSVFILLFNLVGFTSYAQNLVEDMGKMQQSYAALDNYHGEITTLTYGDLNNKPIDSRKMEVRKKGNSFFYELDGMKMIYNENYTLTSNTKSKVIAFQKTPKQTKSPFEVVPDIKEILKKYQDVEYKGVVDGAKLYVVKNPRDIISTVELYIDAQTFLMTKLVYHYNPKLKRDQKKSVILMKNMSTNPQFSTDLFSEKKYVTIKGEKVKLNSRYQQFELVLGEGLAYWQKE